MVLGLLISVLFESHMSINRNLILLCSSIIQEREMGGSANGATDLSSEMEVDAFRRLFPLRFHERHLVESVRPDARPLGKARETSLALG